MVEALVEKLRNPAYLPNEHEIIHAMQSHNQGHMDYRLWHRTEGEETFEFLNQEFIHELGSYLLERIGHIPSAAGKPVLLEIGAGDGRLTHFLKNELGDRATMIATDSGQWGLNQPFPVQTMDYQQALKTYQPTFVICSWMMNNQDFSSAIRTCPSVNEYVLIGSTEVCGKPWETYGETYEGYMEQFFNDPPFEVDGFSQQIIPDPTAHQLCRMDWIHKPTGQIIRHSQTRSFRRVSQKNK